MHYSSHNDGILFDLLIYLLRIRNTGDGGGFLVGGGGCVDNHRVIAPTIIMIFFVWVGDGGERGDMWWVGEGGRRVVSVRRGWGVVHVQTEGFFFF